MNKIILILFLGCPALSFAQVNGNGPTKDSSLMVNGDGFLFSLKEPQGWIGDIDNAAKYESNIILYKSKSDLNDGGPIFQVRVFSKQDENTIGDLNYDINSYKKEYPKLKQQNLEAKHTQYKTFSKLIYVENSFFQYITYINPGNKFKNGISVAMNISKRPATEKELEAYMQIVKSITMF